MLLLEICVVLWSIACFAIMNWYTAVLEKL
jgi:hypothetical protein